MTININLDETQEEEVSVRKEFEQIEKDLNEAFPPECGDEEVKEPEEVPKVKIRNSKLSHHELMEIFLEHYHVRNIGGVLYVYEEPLYRRADKNRVIELARAALTRDEKVKLNMGDWNGFYEYLFTVSSIKLAEVPVYPGCVWFRNGGFHIVMGKSLEPSPDTIFLYELDAKYKPEKKPSTPVFNRFLNQISGGDKSIKRRLLAALGYCLIPDQAKVAIVFAGVPNSGKSLIGRFLQSLIGDDLVSAVAMDDLGGTRNFLMGQLVGKVLNVAMDMNSDGLTGKAVSNLKGLTGRDRIPVENKFDDPFFHRSITKHLFGTNTQICLKKDDPGFWERILIVPCLYGVDPQDQDPDLLDRLLEERNGIICQLMRAARKLIQHRYVFPKCEVADKIKASWRKGLTSSVEAFLDECCSFDDADAFTPTKEIQNSYEGFCVDRSFSPESKNLLSRRLGKLPELEHERCMLDGKLQRGFRGISLKNTLGGEI